MPTLVWGQLINAYFTRWTTSKGPWTWHLLLLLLRKWPEMNCQWPLPSLHLNGPSCKPPAESRRPCKIDVFVLGTSTPCRIFTAAMNEPNHISPGEHAAAHFTFPLSKRGTKEEQTQYMLCWTARILDLQWTKLEPKSFIMFSTLTQ